MCELELEKAQLIKKGKRAIRRQVRGSELEAASDVDNDCASTSSGSLTPSVQSASLLPSLSTLSSSCSPTGTSMLLPTDQHF